MKFTIKNGIGTSATCYQAALMIRQQVFVKEQHVAPELEIENEDQAKYYVGYLDSAPAATARVIEQVDGGWHIQRVATLKKFRRQGLARQILNFIEAKAKKAGIPYLTLGAQDQAQGFYLKLGYSVIGDGFLDAGIKHHRMEKKLYWLV
ncbi:GNAT family N-acetyltransferase [Liquorilactobacillus vini]|uniref:Acetyltransferase n=2 Tax=Liquorilactobacillus vini TaxID=238015 RepID=A0A0R2BZU9_9LACO|nr:GNAT family N-acetyltransferase [Liquorilactobacillus vini]KRM84554.1 acetyltransferase [Liquorilactobacillus vini DSM 20605]